MSNTKIDYVVWLVFGYSAWIIGAYAWDWCKRLIARQRSKVGNEEEASDPDAAVEQLETVRPATVAKTIDSSKSEESKGPETGQYPAA